MVNFASRALPRLYKVFFVDYFCWDALMILLLCWTGMRNLVMEHLLTGFDGSCSLRPWRHINFIVHDKAMKGILEILYRASGFVIVNIFCREFIFLEVQSGLACYLLTSWVLFGWMTCWLILIHKVLECVWVIYQVRYFFVFTLILNLSLNLPTFWTLHLSEFLFWSKQLHFY